MDLAALWQGLGWPLVRLCFFVSLGLLVGTLIEALNWVRFVAVLATPLTRAARLTDVSGAAFSMAFFSGVSANTMLAEAHARGRITGRELLFSNLFNSMPTFFLHLPTMYAITRSIVGQLADVYVGLAVLAAVLRTGAVVLAGRLFNPPLEEGCIPCRLDEQKPHSLREALGRALSRFSRRIRRILGITVPVYALFFLLQEWGLFTAIETFMATHLSFLSWLPPQVISVVALQSTGELAAGLSALRPLLDQGAIAPNMAVLTLLLGNVLSSPMRTIRHQYPYYAGIFPQRVAVRLIVASQTLRAASMALVTAGYVLFAF
ncbi:membrane protein [Desulfocurvus vexinensis]|uniref:membrane protein n=1 Tax=Desulfocurvus vexinensis TaxID=399548 RepID=UPI00048D732D|nr:membrane protein [Desulfocurvus vexinensis]